MRVGDARHSRSPPATARSGGKYRRIAVPGRVERSAVTGRWRYLAQ